MSKKSLVAFSLIVIIVSIANIGCNLPDSPRVTMKKALIYDHEQWMSRMEIWKQSRKEYEQKVKNNLTQLESIEGQETSLLKTLDTDEQRQLYADFTEFFWQSNDEIKVYEFIEKLRVALPADKMEKVMELYRQLKQNESENDSLQKQKIVLKERLMQLGREKDELARRGDTFIMLQQLSY
jgi:hypothetical protein